MFFLGSWWNCRFETKKNIKHNDWEIGNPIKPKLLSTSFLEKTNSTTVLQTINESLNVLFNGKPNYNKLELILSDQASYMLKAISNLKILYPNVKHVTCIIHALHLVCELLRNENQDVNEYVSNFQNLFVRSL